jgi:hypothetical protein
VNYSVCESTFTTMTDRCKKGIHNRQGQEVRKNLWQEGDDGLRYKWNKVGEVKDYEFTCADCGAVQEFLPL